MNLTDLIGKIPSEARSIEDVKSAEVSVRKDKRDALSTLDMMKPSKSAREGGSEKITFFVIDGTASNDFKSVYDLQMQVDVLITSLTLYVMMDIFQVLTVETMEKLEKCAVELNRVNTNLVDMDEENFAEIGLATNLVMEAEDGLANVESNPKNLLTEYKDVSV